MLDLLFLSDNLAISIFSAVFHKFVSSDLCGSSTTGGKLFSPKYPPRALASVLGCVVTLQLGAFSVVLETTLSGITAQPLGAFAALMQPIHLAIGLVEGLITAAVLLFVYQTRPELLQGAAGTGAKNRCSRKAALAILSTGTPDALAMAIITGDEKTLTAAPGIGKKIAQRIILELKDKLAKESAATGLDFSGGTRAVSVPAFTNKATEAAQARAVLGYTSAEVAQALKGVDVENLPLEEIIQQRH